MRLINRTDVYILVFLLLPIFSTNAHAQSTGSASANIVLSLIEASPEVQIGARRDQNDVSFSSLGDGSFSGSLPQGIKIFGLDAEDFTLSTFVDTASTTNGEAFASSLVTGAVSFTNTSDSAASVIFELSGEASVETIGGMHSADFLPSSIQLSFASTLLSVSSDDMTIDFSNSLQSEIRDGVGGGMFNSVIAESYTLNLDPFDTTTLTFRNSSLTRSVVTSAVPEPSSSLIVCLSFVTIAIRRNKTVW